jgi:hypothetical protein
MEVGEPVCVSVPGKDDDKPCKLKAHIVSVEFDTTVRAFLNGAEVKTPHWAEGVDVQDDWSSRAKRTNAARTLYSKRPAIFTPQKGALRATITVKVTESENVGPEGTLQGTLGPLEITGSCETGVGEHEVYAKINEDWKAAIDARIGDITWGLTVDSPGMSVSLGTTFVEVYMLLADPVDMYKGKVPVEALRLLTQKVGVVGKSSAEDVAVAVTRYLHKSHGLSYDVVEGGSAYSVSETGRSSYPVADYALRLHDVINCYDQAAGVQSLAGAVGASIKWLFMQPYGFIKPTHLVGDTEECNNPFYKAVHPQGDVVTNKKKIDRMDIHRFGFWNHAFCALPYKKLKDAPVLDACAGPHLGSERLEDYINGYIDHDEDVNKQFEKWSGLHYPGDLSKVDEPEGITSIDPSTQV